MKTSKLMEELFGESKENKKAKENPFYNLMLQEKNSKELEEFNEEFDSTLLAVETESEQNMMDNKTFFSIVNDQRTKVNDSKSWSEMQ